MSDAYPSQAYPQAYPPDLKNPCSCCCSRLSSGVRAMALIEIVFGVLGTLASALNASGVLKKPTPEELTSHVSSAIISIIMLITGIILLNGVNNRSIAACRTWFIVTLIVDVLHLANSIYDVMMNHVFFLMSGVLVGIVVSWYLLYVVHCFIQEIRQYPLGIEMGGGGGMMLPPAQQSFYQPAYPTAMPTSSYSVTYQSSYQAQQDVATSGG
ncbi:hypothetical protein Fcan01_27298 [Folsomia candida]|uniref:Uncharacterized protein n=1 Tax=Folsomia candida TaxID=158441 RepID=A0A226D110_FOLCA|nr:hypothetical protein Fcan01_27298 [Folsomia candida]